MCPVLPHVQHVLESPFATFSCPFPPFLPLPFCHEFFPPSLPPLTPLSFQFWPVPLKTACNARSTILWSASWLALSLSSFASIPTSIGALVSFLLFLPDGTVDTLSTTVLQRNDDFIVWHRFFGRRDQGSQQRWDSTTKRHLARATSAGGWNTKSMATRLIHGRTGCRSWKQISLATWKTRRIHGVFFTLIIMLRDRTVAFSSQMSMNFSGDREHSFQAPFNSVDMHVYGGWVKSWNTGSPATRLIRIRPTRRCSCNWTRWCGVRVHGSGALPIPYGTPWATRNSDVSLAPGFPVRFESWQVLGLLHHDQGGQHLERISLNEIVVPLNL